MSKDAFQIEIKSALVGLMLGLMSAWGIRGCLRDQEPPPAPPVCGVDSGGHFRATDFGSGRGVILCDGDSGAVWIFRSETRDWIALETHNAARPQIPPK